MFGVHASSILKWIRRCATEHEVKPDPTGKAIVVEIDEVWHFLKKNAASSGSGRLLIVLQATFLIGNVGVVIQPSSRPPGSSSVLVRWSGVMGYRGMISDDGS
jgi:transposase